MKQIAVLLMLLAQQTMFMGSTAADEPEPPTRSTVGWLTTLDPIARHGTIAGVDYYLGPAFEPLPVQYRDTLGASIETLVVGMYVAVDYVHLPGGRRATAIRVIEGTYENNDY